MSLEARDAAITRLVDAGWSVGVHMIPPGRFSVGNGVDDALSLGVESNTHNMLLPLTPEEWKKEQSKRRQLHKANLIQ